MGKTLYQFKYDGSKQSFLNKIDSWKANTTEGKRYRPSKVKNDAIACIQRGKGMLTAPIFYDFFVTSEDENQIDVQIKGYVKNVLMPGISIGNSPIKENSSFLIPRAWKRPRLNGWRDMIKLLDYFEIKEYQQSEIK